jgi:DNA repair exonuclease SbcCD ATPase subunit
VFTSLEIRNFQSLAKVKIRLGRLTVITGPSNSGKSGMRRALELLARNAKGTDYITRGAKSCAVALVDDDPATGTSFVTILQRFAGRSAKDFYELRHSGPDGAGSGTYTKLAGKVPDDVAQVLRLSGQNFAGQFDMPYLMGSAGTEVARALGELTNVTMVFNAAAEAGRRRKGIERDLKGAEARVAELREQVQSFAGLGGRRKAAAGASSGLAALLEHERELVRLEALSGRLSAAQEERARAQDAAAALAPPSLEKLDALIADLERLEYLAGDAEAGGTALAQAMTSQERAESAETLAHQALHDALVAAGQCPLCGQAVA